MPWWRKTYCPCGSGLERGFCSHRKAMATGAINQNGKRVEPRKKK